MEEESLSWLWVYNDPGDIFPTIIKENSLEEIVVKALDSPLNEVVSVENIENIIEEYQIKDKEEFKELITKAYNYMDTTDPLDDFEMAWMFLQIVHIMYQEKTMDKSLMKYVDSRYGNAILYTIPIFKPFKVTGGNFDTKSIRWDEDPW